MSDQHGNFPEEDYYWPDGIGTTSKTASEQASASVGRCVECGHPDLEDAHPADSWHREYGNEHAEHAAQARQIAELQGIIWTYGQHRAQCPAEHDFAVCDCGWDQVKARAALEEPQGEKSQAKS